MIEKPAPSSGCLLCAVSHADIRRVHLGLRRLLTGFTVWSSFFHLLVLGHPSLLEEHGFDQFPLSFGTDPFSVFLCSVSGRPAVTPPVPKPVQQKIQLSPG